MKALLLLWLAGACLRITVLAIPPVIPQIHDAFALSQAAIGALASLPVLLFSFAAIPGAILVSRLGAVRVVTLGLFLTAIAGALRGLSFDAAMLFATTFAMGAGVAIMQPALPAVVREWVPERVALGIAVYSNGLLVGEALSASLTIPFVLPAVHGDWRWSMVVWSVPVIAVALAFLRPPRARVDAEASRAPRRWWPDWSDPVTWGVGILAGYASALYYAANAFLPDYLASRGRPDLLNAALSALNWVQLPASFLMLAFNRRLTLRRWPFLALGSLSLVALAGLLGSDGGWMVAWSGVIGFCNAFLLILTLALPPLLARHEDVPRLSAAMLLVGYLLAFATPIAGGFAWDATGRAAAAFAPLAAFGVISLGVGAWIDFGRAKRG